MKAEQSWQPSKFVLAGGRWTSSKKLDQVGRGSRLNATLLAQAFSRAIPLHCAGRLLDLGCGQVPLYGMYRPHVQEICCIDWDSSAHSLTHVDMSCDLNEPLPLENESYDTILLSDVLEHIFEPRRLLAEMSRVLRPGGNLLMSVPFMYWIHEAPHDYFRYTEFALRRMAKERGMKVVVLEPIGGAVDVLADIIGKAGSRLPLGGLGVGGLLQRLALWIGGSKLGARLRHESAKMMPLGYLLVLRREAFAVGTSPEASQS